MKPPWLVLLLLLSTTATAAPGDNGVGMNIHVANQAFIDASADLGVTWVRVDGNWFVMEPADDQYQWAAMDAGVTRAHAAGLKVFITLGYTPAWVPRHGDTDGSSHNDVPNGSSEWTDFVTAAVTRYRAMGVTHFGLWNEPNLENFFEGTVNEFATLIANPGAAALRAVCSDCVVLGPELANVGASDDYLRSVLMLTPGTWDIITHHIYNDWEETGWYIWDGDSFLNALEQRRFSFTRASLREVLDEVGWTGEVWITETGYRATPPGDVQEEDFQAIYFRRVLEEQLLRPWWTNSFFYEMHDCGPDQPACTIDGFGIMRATGGAPGSRTFPTDYRTKPAFDELKDFIAQNPAIVGTAPPPPPPPPPQIVAPGLNNIVVDANLTEWSNWLELGGPEWVGTEPLSGANDLLVRAALRWDIDALYMAVEVTDDNHDNAHPTNGLWQGDSLQIAFDVGRSGGTGYDTVDDHEITFALTNGSAFGFRDHGPATATDDWTVAIVRSGTTTSYEIRLDGSVLPSLLIGESSIAGFSFLVNDADGNGRVGWIEWTPGIGAGKVPESFGELFLGARDHTPPPMDAGVPIPDAGQVDGGGPPPDSGTTPSDAGSTPPDGGAVQPDATTPGPEKDGGIPAGDPPPNAASNSSTGCACTAHEHRGGTAVWLLVGALALATRRRQRRAAGTCFADDGQVF